MLASAVPRPTGRPVTGIEAACWRRLEPEDPADGSVTSLRDRLAALTQAGRARPGLAGRGPVGFPGHRVR